MSFLKSLIKMFKKLWNAIKKVLAILLIVIAVVLIVWAAVFSGGAALMLFGFAITQTGAFILGALALTGAFLVDGETASKTVGKIGDAMGDAAGAVGGAIGGAVGDGIGGIADGIFGSSGGTLLMIGLIVGGFMLFSSSSDEPDKATASVNKPKEPAKVPKPEEKPIKRGAPVRSADGYSNSNINLGVA